MCRDKPTWLLFGLTEMTTFRTFQRAVVRAGAKVRVKAQPGPNPPDCPITIQLSFNWLGLIFDSFPVLYLAFACTDTILGRSPVTRPSENPRDLSGKRARQRLRAPALRFSEAASSRKQGSPSDAPPTRRRALPAATRRKNRTLLAWADGPAGCFAEPIWVLERHCPLLARQARML